MESYSNTLRGLGASKPGKMARNQVNSHSHQPLIPPPGNIGMRLSRKTAADIIHTHPSATLSTYELYASLIFVHFHTGMVSQEVNLCFSGPS